MQSTNPTTTRPAKRDNKAIKLPILAPLFVAITVLLAIFTLAIYRLQQQHISDDVRMRLDSSDRYFNKLLFADARLIGEITHFVKDNPDIQNAWLAKDRNTLLTLTAPIFEKLRQDYRITHLYFIDTNSTCFLRVHNPPRFGDHIERFTLKSTADTAKPYWGIELGQYGTFTLRVVQPWFVNNTLTGFIEFGEEIDHISPQLKETLNVDLVFLINKSLLSRENWQEGLKMMGRTGDWNLMPNCVIADSTMSDIPPEFIKFARLPHEEHRNHILTAKLNGSTFSAGLVKLSDAAAREVGDILVIKNITKEQAALQKLLAVAAIASFLIVSLLVSFFYIHIAGIEKHIIEAHTSLAAEIEKRKEIEAELRKHRDNLEELVNTRTSELQEINAQLQQEAAQRTETEKSLAKVNDDLQFTVAQLSSSNKHLREFDHLAAHDLKTPLRGIGTLAQWLLKDYYDKFDDYGREQVNLLVKRVRRMDNLINAILQYSTIARNKQNEGQVDLNPLIKSVIADIKPTPNITITVNQNLPVLMCEEEQITQVLYNLVANAVKFMDKPDGLITIDFEDEKYFWKFSIADNGPGIEPQHFERIFRLFQTLSDREEAESAGIGLTIAKKIVELYGGKIWLTSTVGVGSTFFFTLPKSQAAIDRQIPQQAQT
ncbi:MAG: ATP-binding protein [Sedimentisphaerales bacterium]|jgi:signal transduction histidine kinase